MDKKHEQACGAGGTVKNDGKALKRLLEEHFSISDFRHTGDYIFRAELSDGSALVIFTEPMDEEGNEIKILNMYRKGAET